ncbi:MAG: aspartate/glutamate racemase family protein [Rubrimonas sp.]
MTREIVLLNGNTTAAMTERMAVAAREIVPAGVSVRGVTAPFGEAYISDRAAAAVAAHAVIEMTHAVASGPPPAAVVIACFGDPGLWAARSILARPVVGMAEASMHAACQLGRRFGIVTGGAAWGPMLDEFAAAAGLSARLSGVRTLALTGAEIAADPQAAASAVAEAASDCVVRDGADVVILGGAGLIGLAPRTAAAVGVPVLDSLACAVTQALALGALAS